MLLPLALLFVATAAAAVMAFGTHPLWAQFPHGIQLIVLTRRLQWPLIALCIVLCLVLLTLVISGRRRAWWLIGLAPILTLFVHHFALDPNNAFIVNRQPTFVSAEQANFLADDDDVVGLTSGGDAYAYPFAVLYPAPLVIQTEQAQPLILLWSPFANRALAAHIERSIKPRELEIVSMPANTLLVYNSRLGQFINGVTGLTMQGQTPTGFLNIVPTQKMTWQQWRTLHPHTRVLAPVVSDSRKMPTRPLLPYYPMPKTDSTLPPETTVAMICTTRPSVILDSDLDGGPCNVDAQAIPLLLVHDSATGSLHAYDRRVLEDLIPLFSAKKFSTHPEASMIDSDSNSAWTSDARAVDGPLKGQWLKPVPVDDQVYYDVLCVWYPRLSVLTPVLPEQPPTDSTQQRHRSNTHAH